MTRPDQCTRPAGERKRAEESFLPRSAAGMKPLARARSGPGSGGTSALRVKELLKFRPQRADVLLQHGSHSMNPAHVGLDLEILNDRRDYRHHAATLSAAASRASISGRVPESVEALLPAHLAELLGVQVRQVPAGRIRGRRAPPRPVQPHASVPRTHRRTSSPAGSHAHTAGTAPSPATGYAASTRRSSGRPYREPHRRSSASGPAPSSSGCRWRRASRSPHARTLRRGSRESRRRSRTRVGRCGGGPRTGRTSGPTASRALPARRVGCGSAPQPPCAGEIEIAATSLRL